MEKLKGKKVNESFIWRLGTNKLFLSVKDLRKTFLMKIIPYSTQNIDKSDIKLVNLALKKDLLTSGEYVKTLKIKLINLSVLNFQL